MRKAEVNKAFRQLRQEATWGCELMRRKHFHVGEVSCSRGRGCKWSRILSADCCTAHPASASPNHRTGTAAASQQGFETCRVAEHTGRTNMKATLLGFHWTFSNFSVIFVTFLSATMLGARFCFLALRNSSRRSIVRCWKGSLMVLGRTNT